MGEVLDNVVFVLLFFCLFVSGHELTHGSVFEAYGCSDIGYGVLSDGAVAFAEADCSGLSGRELLSLRESQMMVEAVGYQVVFVLVAVLVLYFKP